MDPDIGLTEEEIEEQRRKMADPRRLYTRSDQMYPDAKFRPSYVDPSMEKPVYQGMLPGGAEESDISPIDFITEVPSLAKAGLKGFPAIIAAIKKKGSELPEDMSLLERIKLAAKRSGVKAPEMEAAQAEREALRNKPKDYFDRAREKANQKIFQENEKKLAEEAAAREAFKAEFNLPVAHGTNLSKTSGKTIEEFTPSVDGSHGPGIYTAIRHPGEDPISNMYTSSIDRYGKEGGMSIPLVARGGKIFNLVPSEFEYLHPELKDIIPSRKKSFEKLSELTGIPVNELPKGALHDKYKLEELIRQYPEHFEGMLDNENAVRIFENKNLRMPWAKFDPAKKESGDILAGLAGAGLSFNQIKEFLNKKSTDKDEL